MRIPNLRQIIFSSIVRHRFTDIPKGYQRVFLHRGKIATSIEKRVRPPFCLFCFSLVTRNLAPPLLYIRGSPSATLEQLGHRYWGSAPVSHLWWQEWHSTLSGFSLLYTICFLSIYPYKYLLYYQQYPYCFYFTSCPPSI